MPKRKTIVAIVVIIALVVAIVAGGSFLVMRHLKYAAEYMIGQTLGAQVEMKTFSINLKTNTLRMTEFRLHNPEGFTEDPLLAFLPEITGKFDRNMLFKNKKFHFTELYLYVKTVIIIKSKDGKFNIDELAIFKNDFEELPISTDRLTLTSDFAVYKDLSKKDLPHTETFDVGIKNASYDGFPTVDELSRKVVSEIMSRTTIRGVGIAGVAMLVGAIAGWPVAIPAGATMVLTTKDGYQKTFKVSREDAYQAAVEAANAFGKKVSEQKEKGLITGYIDGANVKILIMDAAEEGKTDIKVTARKNLLPKVNIAGGVLYEIAQRLVAEKKI